MDKIHLRLDTKGTELGFLSPQDLELNGAVLDLFYMLCLNLEAGHTPIKSNPGYEYLFHYSLKVDKVEFSNPFDIWATLRNISNDTVKLALDRTLFFQSELKRRDAEVDKIRTETEISQQTVIAKKLENIQTALEMRKKFFKSDLASDDIAKQIAHLLSNQGLTLSSDDAVDKSFT